MLSTDRAQLIGRLTLVHGLPAFLAGVAATALCLQSMAANPLTAEQFLSSASFQKVAAQLGGPVITSNVGLVSAEIPLAGLLIPLAFFGGLTAVAGALWISRRRQCSFRQALAQWLTLGWLWWLLPGVWEGMRLVAFVANWEAGQSLIPAIASLWCATSIAGWLATLCILSGKSSQANAAADESLMSGTQARAQTGNRIPWSVWLVLGVYVVVFTAMNWQLYFGLLLPHGDSAMYEEHLWNVTHGKGFRSYLDQGLFLGEHIQVIHLLLLPVYLVWPSQLSLELCQSLGLAAGAIPVFWMGQRHTGSRKVAALLAVAYLLYFPMQFLDIAIDLKTFRPNAFGITALLFALDQLERRRYWTMGLLMLVTLSAQEDFAIALAPLGLWIALFHVRFVRARSTPPSPQGPSDRSLRLLGIAVALLAGVYLWLVLTQVLPYFRGGREIHYVGYFSRFGETAAEVIRNMLLHPGMLWDALATTQSLYYVLLIVVPLGFLPLCSPSRLAVGIPELFLLCLNQLAADPRHHFHAPLVPIVIWATIAGVGRVAAFRANNALARAFCLDERPGDGFVLRHQSAGHCLLGSRLSLLLADAVRARRARAIVPARAGSRSEHQQSRFHRFCSSALHSL